MRNRAGGFHALEPVGASRLRSHSQLRFALADEEGYLKSTSRRAARSACFRPPFGVVTETWRDRIRVGHGRSGRSRRRRAAASWRDCIDRRGSGGGVVTRALRVGVCFFARVHIHPAGHCRPSQSLPAFRVAWIPLEGRIIGKRVIAERVSRVQTNSDRIGVAIRPLGRLSPPISRKESRKSGIEVRATLPVPLRCRSVARRSCC